MLKVYNTLGKKLEEFRPLKEGLVTMYVCGPTVYWYLHVGNFRGPVFFNFVRNWLEYLGYKVVYALNFTDVEDKIINKAKDENKTASEVSEFYIEEYKKDFFALKLRSHDHNPKVTEFMPEIILMISELIKRKKAYVASSVTSSLTERYADVNYSIDEFKDYGKLSGRKTEELKEGVRIDVNEQKKNPLDFVLWKAVKPEDLAAGQPSWDSPWGKGRPGWHIECSAMAKAIFGEQIDIHGGGLDLLFPHHENEIAQSEGCSGHTFVKYWLHWNMLNLSGSKMSKSLGNVISLRDFLKDHHSEIYKWMILSVHYRSVADFSDEAVQRAITGLAKFYSAMALAAATVQGKTLSSSSAVSLSSALDEKYQSELKQAWKSVEESFNDDFGTPAAFAVVFEVIRKFNSRVHRGMKVNAQVISQCEQFLDFVKKFGALLGLFQESPQSFLTELDDRLLVKLGYQRSAIDKIVAERARAREVKDFTKADELRKELTTMNIAVSDMNDGSFWEVMK